MKRRRKAANTLSAVKHLVKVNKGLIYAVQELREEIEQLKARVEPSAVREFYREVPDPGGVTYASLESSGPLVWP